MKIILIHQHVPDGAAADERDVLEQVAAIRDALTANGHDVSTLSCTTDLGNTQRKLTLLKPDCIFNLVETLDGSGSLIHLAPAVWEVAGLPFTGCSSEALYLTTHKLLSKERMSAAGLPVPAWVAARELAATTVQGDRLETVLQATGAGVCSGDADASPAVDWIIKSVWEHASIGLSDASVLRGVTAAEVAARVPEGSFAEWFVEGREFNLALLAGADGPVVLPPAEIVFEDYPADKPRIVGYQAKWDETSFEYAHTVRRFTGLDEEGALLAELGRLAVRCWEVFSLSGYARVDFRVDAAGRPWILEVNSNPCLAPDSGFAAALEQAGIPYAEALARIVAAAVGRPASADHAEERAGAARASPSSVCGAVEPKCGLGTPSSGEGSRLQRAAALAPSVAFRYEAVPTDVEAVRDVTASTGYFHDHEIPVAVELVEERLAKGAASGYEFVFAECDGRVVGYTAFGPIPCTQSSFDWYWLAVRPESQGFGFGKRLLRAVETRARAMGGTRLYCETSGRPQYASTRAFYERLGFTLCEVLEDYYEPGDGRATYVKLL